MENKLERNDLIHKKGYKKKDKTCSFQKFTRIRSFGKEICKNDSSLDDAREHISKESTKPKESVKKEKYP